MSLSSKLDFESMREKARLMALCPLQDSLRYRARHLGLKIAVLVIDESGNLVKKELEECKKFFNHPPFSLEEEELLIFPHIRSVLFQLESLWPDLKKFSMPLCHKKAEEFVRETLLPESIRTLQDAHIRRAVLASWLTFLRQATGSCFATAPAILIQQQYPKQLLKDLYELLSTGQLKRVFSGKEYKVPLSLSAGGTDLQRSLVPFQETLTFSPGLREAIAAVGASWPSKVPVAETAEKWLRAVLLQAVGLTEEAILEEENLARLQMTPLLTRPGAVYYQKPTERAQRISDFKKKFAKALSFFQAFAECALLRAWEYTLASFCDLKVDFARWNLTIGLGLHPDQKMGIGSFLYEWIQERHQREEREVERLHKAYIEASEIVQGTEGMIRAALSDSLQNQLKVELAKSLQAANIALEARDQTIQKMEFLASLLPTLIQFYHDRLPEYFQELYDPSLFTEEAHLLDDSPAGFRLIFKHGRTDPTQWTPVHSAEQYLSALREWLTSTEGDLTSLPSPDPTLFTEIATALLQFIQKKEFLEAAFARSREQGRRSPWDYISGGNLQTLLQSYCNREHPFTESKLIPRSPQELLSFLHEIKRHQKNSLLMQSPTHAFIFYPELLPDHPEKIFSQKVQSKPINEQEQESLIHRFADRLPSADRALLIHRFRQLETATTLSQLRLNLLGLLSHKNKMELVDAFFFEELKSSQFLLFADTNWSGWFFGFVLNPVTGALELWRLNQQGTRGYPMSDWSEWLSPTNTAPWIVLSKREEYTDLFV